MKKLILASLFTVGAMMAQQATPQNPTSLQNPNAMPTPGKPTPQDPGQGNPGRPDVAPNPNQSRDANPPDDSSTKKKPNYKKNDQDKVPDSTPTDQNPK